MNQEQLFSNIQRLLIILNEYNAKRQVKMSANDSELLRQTYLQIMPYVQMNLTCSSCVVHYLDMISAWYQKNYPVYVQCQMNVESEIKSNKKEK